MAAVTPAVAVLERAKIAYRLISYEHDPAAPSYGREAAEALGVDPAEVYKTLVASLDGRLVVAVVAVTGELSLKGLAEALGAKRAVMASVADVERATGSVVGGVSPFGHRRQMPVVVDDAAMNRPTMYVSAGRRGLELAVAPSDLVRAASATVAPIGRSDSRIATRSPRRRGR
jgi:Cys-tRNA(Pro)/Cys-tRNA(Cys) deacylase